MAGNQLAVLIGKRRALVQRIVLAVDHGDGVAAAIEHKHAPAVAACNAIDRAFAEWDARGNGEA